MAMAVSDFLDSVASIFSNQLRNSVSRGRDRDWRISRRSSGGLPRTSLSTAYSAAMRLMASAAMADLCALSMSKNLRRTWAQQAASWMRPVS
jgi:hypothetical protein